MITRSGTIRSLGVFTLVCSLAAAELCGQMAFRSRRDINIPEFNGPVAIATDDLNGDQLLDLVVANAFAGTLSVLLADGHSGFTPVGSYPVDPFPFSIVIRDFNNDGRLDLAAANQFYTTICVLLGNGNGTFQPARFYQVSAQPTTLVAGDFNNDGNLDLAVACIGPFTPEQPELANNTISVFLGNGRGDFAPPPCGRDFEVGRAPEGIDVGHFTFEGNLDLAVANLFSNTVTVLLNDGRGCFSHRTDYPVGLRPSTVAVGDFNNDFIPDLVTVNEGSFTVSTLLGNGDGSFMAARHFPSAPPLAYGLRLTAADLNSDGRLDVAIAGATDEVRILLGDGQGRLLEPVRSFRTGADITAHVAAGDFNYDGVLDLATANKGAGPPPPERTGNVSVLTGDGMGNFGVFLKMNNGIPAPVAGDFNLDGMPDLAVANASDNDVAIFLGDGQGGFYFWPHFPVGNRPTAVIADDFNGDYLLDLATANAGSNTVTVLLGDGTGSFPLRRDFAVGAAPSFLAAGDFNQDNLPDLAVANLGSNNLTVLLGDGLGGFSTRREFAVGTRPSFLVASDVNNDGKLDLAVANSGSDSVTVLLGDGNGGFPARMDANLAPGSRPSSLAAARFRGTAYPDLAVANNGPHNVTILYGDGTGRFPTNRVIALPQAAGPSFISAVDLNRDQRVDLVVANADSNNVSVLQGDGTGNFSIAVNPNPFAGLRPVYITLGDFNNDGRPDLVFGNAGSATLSILFNYSTP